MDDSLFALTSAANFVCLVVSLWLGFYIVTRSPRSKVSWLASATLWSLCGYFLNGLTYLQRPASGGALPWWWGWSVAFAAPFWLCMSLLLYSSEPTRNQRLLIGVAFFLALNFAAMEAYTPWIHAGATTRAPIYNSVQRPGPLYPLFVVYLILVAAVSLYILDLCRKRACCALIRQQFIVFQWAATLAVFSTAYTGVSSWLGLDTPVLISSLGLGAGVALLGYGVARYNALVEGSGTRLDLVYTASAMLLVVGLYLLAAWLSGLIFNIPLITFVFVIMLTIVSHSLYDWARTYWDRFFYRQQYREVRANLRELARTTTSDRAIGERVSVLLESICNSLQASSGFIARKQAANYVVIARWPVGRVEQTVSSAVLDADDLLVLSPSKPIPELTEAAVIVPLHAGGAQIGAIGLGSKVTGINYTEDDLAVLEDCGNMTASLVHTALLQDRNMEHINALLKEFREREEELQNKMQQALRAPPLPVVDETEVVSLTEDALRHLDDYVYLGGHKLAQLSIIGLHAVQPEGKPVTYLDRGRALHETLTRAIEKLRPSGAPPTPATREWHPYIILHDCYVLGKPNRDVMSELYVSDSTFNRTRRRAIRGVAQALNDMEKEAHRGILVG